MTEAWLARHFPHEDIPSQDGTLYMRRYRLVGFKGRIPWFFGLNIFVHRIEQPDVDRDPHDHPWPFLSFVLQGGYTEERWGHHAEIPRGTWDKFRTVERRRFSIRFRRARDLHRIRQLAGGGPAWTFVVTAGYGRKWGFWTGSGWVDHSEYFKVRTWPEKRIGGGPPEAA